MDDPFGCLRGVESDEHDLYKLTSEIVEKKFNELPRINHCPSCEVHLVNMMNEFCRECPECHRVFEYYDDDDQFQELSPGRSAAPPASPALLGRLKTVLRKFTKSFLSTRSLFWEMLLLIFRRKPASQ